MKIRKKDGTFKEIIYNEQQLYKYGINRLSEREWGRQELKEKMARLQPEGEMVDRVLDKLEAQSYLSDERRAKMMLRQYIQREGVGKIKYRMKDKGLPADVIAKVIEEYEESQSQDDGNPEELKAIELLGRKFKSYDRDNYNKMTRFLASRGFRGDAIRKAMESLKLSPAED